MIIGAGLTFAPNHQRRSGAAPLVITQSAPLFFDTADSTNTTVTGRTGWTRAGDATKGDKIKSADGMFRMNTGSNGESPYGFQLTPAPGTPRRITFEYDYSQQGGTLSNSSTPYQWYDQRVILAWQDISNYLSVQPGAFGGGVMEFRIYQIVAGASTEIFRYVGLPTSGIVSFELIGDRVRCMLGATESAMLLRVPDQLYTDSTALFPDKKFAVGSPAIRTGAAGLRHCFHPLILAGSVKVEDITLYVDDPKEFYGRDTATNSRSITFTGTYTGTPVSWAYRLRRRSTGAVVKDWAVYAPTFGSGTFSGAITVATGGPYFIDIGWTGADSETRVYTPNHFAVGALWICYGQSNAANQTGIGGSGAGYGGNDLVLGFNGYATYIGSTFRRWADELTPKSFALQPNMVGLAKSLSDAIGIPVGVAAYGVASQALANLKPGTANWTAFLAFVTEIGGYYEGVMWDQGEAEALSLIDYSVYASTDYPALVAGFQSNGGNTGSKVFNRIIGKSTAATNDATTTLRSSTVRAMLNNLQNSNDVWTGTHSIGIPLSDSIHFTNAGCTKIAYLTGLTIARRAYGALAYDGRGPLVTGASRVGAVITLAVDLNGTSGISGTALTGYEVSNDDFSTLLTQSSAVVVADQIVITLSSTPTGTVKVRSFAQPNYTETSLATGTLPGAVTVAVFPILTPITVT